MRGYIQATSSPTRYSWQGRYEPEVSSVIQAFIRVGFSFVDVGANIGLHTLAAAFARTNDGQRVIAFEPEPSTFELLQRNVASNDSRASSATPRQ